MYPLTETVDGATSFRDCLSLQIGSVCCALKAKDEEFINRMTRLYRNFLSRQPVDITVELEESRTAQPGA